MEAVFKSIDDNCDLEVIRFHQVADGQDYFYFIELSALQVLRELPSTTNIKVTEIFSQRHRVAQKIEIIKSSLTVHDFLKTTLLLVENGTLRCDDLTIILNDQITLSSHDDGEVHLTSKDTSQLHNLITKILTRQGYDPTVLSQIKSRPNLYHKLQRPDIIIASFDTFDQFLESL